MVRHGRLTLGAYWLLSLIASILRVLPEPQQYDRPASRRSPQRAIDETLCSGTL